MTYTYIFMTLILITGLAFILYRVSMYRGPATKGAVFLPALQQNGYSFAELLPYEGFLTPTVVVMKDGRLMGGWSYRGQDLDSSSEEELDVVVDSVNAALVQIGSGWTLHVDVMRFPVSNYPESSFPDPTTKLIDEERRMFGKKDRAYFDATYYLCFSWTPYTDAGEKVKGTLFGVSDSAKKIDPMDQVLKFNAVMDSIGSLLSTRVHLSRRLAGDDLLTYIYRTIVGTYKKGDYEKITLPEPGMFLDEYIGFCVGGVYAGLEPKVGETHVRVIVPGIPQSTYPGVVDFLNSISSSYRWSTRYVLMGKDEAGKELDTKRKYWSQKRKSLVQLVINAIVSGGKGNSGPVNQDAEDMVDDVSEAVRENESDLVRFGFFSTKIILYNNNPNILKQDIERIREYLGSNGYASHVEEVNAFESFLGSLPGDIHYDVRRFLVSTKNLCDMLPTTSVWLGNPLNEHLKGPPLAICRTRGSSPFRFSNHLGDVGHTSLIGPTGAGKTTLLNLIQAQFFRYPNANVFVFDYKNGAFPLVTASGGEYYDIASPNSEKLAFCPLAGISDEDELKWASEWIEDLIRLQINRTIGPNDREIISIALNRLARDPTKAKTITNLMFFLQDEDLRQAIRYYTVGQPMGSLLDSESDSLRDGTFQAFEMQHLMSSGPKVVIPVLLYLFHRIDTRLKGDPTLIVLDEAWTFLGHDIFAEKIRTWLKVLRSKNASVIFASQNLSDVVNSAIKDVIVDNVPTRIFLPNSNAITETSVPFYRAMGLTMRQIEIISMATPKREYYYTNSNRDCQLFELNLGPIQLAFMGAGNSQDIAIIKDIIARCEKHGGRNEWVPEYLESKGLDAAAEEWRRFRGDIRAA